MQPILSALRPTGTYVLKQDISARLIPNLTSLCRPLSLSSFSSKTMTEEWNILDRAFSNPIFAPYFVRGGPEIARLNRFPKILPYKHNIVPLTDRPPTAPPQDTYINANYITNPYSPHHPQPPTFIATQAPLPISISHFYRMLWQERVQTILTLCGPLEAHQYWPQNPSSTLKHGNFCIKLNQETQFNDFYLLREFCIQNIASNETRKLRQFHSIGWADRKVPDKG
jgi:protein tyrosine phosphatase